MSRKVHYTHAIQKGSSGTFRVSDERAWYVLRETWQDAQLLNTQLVSKHLTREQALEEALLEEESRSGELRPLAAFEHLAPPDTLRRAALEGRLEAQKLGRDWLTTERDVRRYLRSRYHISKRLERGEKDTDDESEAAPLGAKKGTKEMAITQKQNALDQLRSRLVNLTPHVINVRVGELTLDLPPSGQVARLEVAREVAPPVLSIIPAQRERRGGITGLPEPQPGIVYVVSFAVAQAAAREDVVAPGPAVRDEQGRIIGCEGFSRP